MIFGSLYRYISYHTPLINKNLTLVSISNLRNGHYVHINNTFSLSSTTENIIKFNTFSICGHFGSTQRPLTLNPGSWILLFRSGNSWISKPCYQLIFSLCACTETYFLRLNSFPQYGHIEPLTQKPWISQFYEGIHEHQIHAFTRTIAEEEKIFLASRTS